ncbi:MAG: hypothetical protein V5A55_02840 [Halovenus sp.]
MSKDSTARATREAADRLAALETTHERLETARDRLTDYDEADIEELADAYQAFASLLDRYEEDVTGDDGDAKTIIEFQSQVHKVMGDISGDVLFAERFEECDEYLQKKWFKKSDFEHVREVLEPAAELVGRLEERDAARREYREARERVRKRSLELSQEIRERERLTRLGDADLDAPTERVRDPIETYNDAVREAFASFKRTASARAVVEFVDASQAYPLAAFPEPPAELHSYICSEPPGTEPIATLLEYADYSRSKLDHYVDDPGRLKHALSGHRTYLERLDAEPLTVSWPPPPGDVLPWRCRALTAVVNRLDPAVVEQLRAVAALPRETDYDRLRDSALAAAELSERERERLQSGVVETELEEARAARQRLDEGLETYPSL